MGTVKMVLYQNKAPITVANFLKYVEAKHYDGTIFHRVIPNFMVQGGDPQGTGMGGPGYQFEDETKGSPHKFDKPGKLAMANAGPNTNGSQFFITLAPTEWLTGKHTIFGEVVEGQDVVEKIVSVPRGLCRVSPLNAAINASASSLPPVFSTALAISAMPS